jgi:O-antigen ligase
VRRGLKKTFVGIFWIVIACGNASRFIPGHFLFGSVNFGELLLYAVVIVALPFYLGRLLMSPLYIVAVSITLLSLLIGLIKWGADFTAILYPIRLILQLSAAAITGTMIFELLGHDVFRFALLTSRVYFYVSVVSILILVVIPDSTMLWAVLGEAGLEFQGDPHSGRLVSTYFDPNFFGAIIALPIALGWTLYLARRSIRVLVYTLVMVLADLLTFSRSGLFLLFMMCVSIFLASVLKRNMGPKLLKYSLIAVAATLPISVSVLLLPEYFDRIIGRFTDIGGDDSAQARLRSFLAGMELIQKEPILGYGYNYGLPATLAVRPIGLDSSLQVLILNFGVILSAVVFIAAALWVKNTNTFVRSRSPIEVQAIWKLLLAYLLLSVVWTSTFNQLLFYTWWLMPVTSWMFYLDNLRRSRIDYSSRQTPPSRDQLSASDIEMRPA